MDVRKLVLVIGVLTLLAVGAVFYFQFERPVARRGRGDPALAERIEARHGPALRAVGIGSLGVDRKTDDVVVVFADGGHLGRKVAGRLPDLAGAAGCGELDVGISVGDSLTAWGNSSDPDFYPRLECVIEEVLARAAELRGGY